MSPKDKLEKAAKWENLSPEEQQEWNNKADKVNKLGLGLFTKVIMGLLEDKTLIVKNDKIMISGVFAHKMLQEKGIPPELLQIEMNKTLKVLIP